MATIFVADRTVAGNARNGQATGYPKIWVRNGYVFQAVIQHDWKLFIHRYNEATGLWDQSVELTSVMGLIDVEDSHDAITMAVDGQGYIHVIGNMHFERLKYAKSNQPYDLTAGFSTGPYPQGWSPIYRNMVKNPDCGVSLNGWSSPTDVRFSTATLHSGKTYAIKPGSSGQAVNLETNCCRVDRTSSSPDSTIGIVYIGGGTTPGAINTIEISEGESIFASISVAADKNPYRASLSVEFRNSSGEVLLTVLGDWFTDLSTSAALSYPLRVICEAGTAPVGATNVRLVVEAQSTGGNASNGDSIFCDAALVVQGDIPNFLPDNEQAGINVYTKRSFYFSPNYSQYDDSNPALEGDRDDPEWWEGDPNESTSITRRLPSGEHYQQVDYSTYQTFGGFSDGGLLWSTNQSKHEVTGTSRTMYRMGPDTGWEWIPLHPATNGVIGFTPTNNVDEDNLDAMPHRYYGYQTWVGADDSINHVGCFRWEPGNDSMDHQLFIRSYDKGETWVDINGGPVPIPLTWPESINSSYEVMIDGTTPIGGAVSGGFASDSNGRPWFVLNTQEARDGTVWSGNYLITHDGSFWRAHSLAAYNTSDTPAIAFLHGDIWIIYRKGGGVLVPKSGHLFLANWTQSSDPELIDLGPVGSGTPDGDYQFESGATYHVAPLHARDGWDERTMIVPVPNNNSPWFYRLGDVARIQE